MASWTADPVLDLEPPAQSDQPERDEAGWGLGGPHVSPATADLLWHRAESLLFAEPSSGDRIIFDAFVGGLEERPEPATQVIARVAAIAGWAAGLSVAGVAAMLLAALGLFARGSGYPIPDWLGVSSVACGVTLSGVALWIYAELNGRIGAAGFD